MLSLYSQSQYIILQSVNLILSKIRKSASKIMKNTLIGKVKKHHFQGASDIFDKRVEQKSPGSVQKNRDVIHQGFPLKIIPIGFHITCYHCNITITKPLLQHQLPDTKTC